MSTPITIPIIFINGPADKKEWDLTEDLDRIKVPYTSQIITPGRINRTHYLIYIKTKEKTWEGRRKYRYLGTEPMKDEEIKNLPSGTV